MNGIRKIIHIDEELCTGCGLCIPGCIEGAMAIINGKARLIKDSFCDGLGGCLGHCPTGALTIIEREAEGFDEGAALSYIASQGKIQDQSHYATHGTMAGSAGRSQVLPKHPENGGTGSGCPGSALLDLRQNNRSQSTIETLASKSSSKPSQKKMTPLDVNASHQANLDGPINWPLKISLVPTDAPFFQNSHLVVAADCVPAVTRYFQSHYASGKVLLLTCPKLGNMDEEMLKIAKIFKNGGSLSCTVLRMDLPCCRALALAVDEAKRLSERDLPVKHIVFSRTGEELG